MGWKNIKEAYGIKHIVRIVPDKGICIGSGYIHDIIVIDKDFNIKRSQHIGRGEPFDSMVRAMEADKAELRRLFDAPDTFAKSVTVYTYDYDGNIIEKKCEEPGWPNITHDGECMYENTFSTDRAQVVEWASANIEATIKSTRRTLADTERELEECRKHLAGYEAAALKLAGVSPGEET